MIQFDEHIFEMGGKKPPTREVKELQLTDQPQDELTAVDVSMFRLLQELHCIAQGVPCFARNVGRSQEKSRDIVGMTRILPFSNLNACNMICFP